MSRKHFDDYFNQISKQYLDLQKVLEDLSEEADKGMIAPEQLEQLKATISPIKSSYESLNYIRYLLDKPTRKAKQTRYDRQNKKIIEKTEHVRKEAVLANNEAALRKLRK